MKSGGVDTLEMLRDGRDRATKLVEDLLRQQAELEANPSGLSAQDLAEGRQAMEETVAAARQMVRSLEEALGKVSSHRSSHESGT